MRGSFTIYSAFLDIKNSISWSQEMNNWYPEIYVISWYQEIYSEAPFYYLLFLDKNSNSLYQEIEFLISGYIYIISWYQEIYSEAPFYNLLSISSYQEIKFKNSISWYQEMELLISRNT